MSYNYTTKHGYNMFDMSSMLQKAIRRGDWTRAGFAACELYYSFYNYLWKRLLVISAEDCYDAVTHEIIALRMADDEVNANKKPGEIRDQIFVSKAIMLLVRANKNRDACYFACNFVTSKNEFDKSTIEHVDDIAKAKLGVEGIPDWVFDKHTLKGKRAGKTSLDMIKAEQEALCPHQMGFFDDGDWYQWHNIYQISDADKKKWPGFAEGRTRYE